MFDTFDTPADGLLTAGQTLNPRCVTVKYTGSWGGWNFQDTFDTFNTSQWSRPHATEVAVNANRLEVYTPTNGNSWNYAGHTFTQPKSYVAQVEVNKLAGSTWFTLDKSGGTYLGMLAESGRLYFRESRSGVSNQTSLPWDAAAMRYWRIIRNGPMVVWQYSSDSRIWLTGRQDVTGISFNAITLTLLAGSGGFAQFDNAMITPITAVRLYGNPSGDLTPYLMLTVERGSGGGSGDCTGFVPTATVYEGALSSFPTNYDQGVGEWFPVGTTQTQTFRFTAKTLDVNDVAGKDAQASFTWEVRAAP